MMMREKHQQHRVALFFGQIIMPKEMLRIPLIWRQGSTVFSFQNCFYKTFQICFSERKRIEDMKEGDVKAVSFYRAHLHTKVEIEKIGYDVMGK
jgi:hypothetical protein